MFDEHFHYEPNRRMNPPHTGDVDTTQMGGIYDVQNMHGHCDPHCGYHIPSVPPLSPVFPAMTESEQLRDLANKVNELCGTIDGYNHKVEDAYRAIINSALCNDGYYREVTVENGYIPESGSNYKVIHIPFLDKANQPIFFELGLAYDNTTNSGVKEGCFDASQRFIADKLVPAQNSDNTFVGTVMWKGAPIFTQEGDSYTFAVTQNGFFKGYKNATQEILKQDKIRNSCGARGILVYNKELATSSFPEDASTMKARIAVGQNYDTKERFLIVVDGGESVGCTSEQLANLFVKYGCMIAVELVSGSSVYGMDKGAMMYSPVVADEYDTPSVPESNAFWYITKRRHYHNEYVKDVALLMQKMGEEIWRRIILNEQTDFVKKSVVELKKALDAEIEERKAEDTKLDVKYAGEVARLDARCETIESESKERDKELNELILTKETESKDRDAELNELILTKERESKERDSQLQVNIDNEADTRFNQDIKKVAHVDDGDKRTYSLYRNDDTKVEENIEVYEYNKLIAQFVTMAQIAENLKTETSERKKADADLQGQITAEVSNRTNAVTDLQSQITEEISNRTNADNILQSNIDNEASGRKNKDDDLQNQINDLNTDSSELAEKINTEISDRKKADTDLQKQITDEVTERTSGVNDLSTKLNKEITDRTNADSDLQTNINNEAIARENKGTELETKIDDLRSDTNIAIEKLTSDLEQEVTNRTNSANAINTALSAEVATRKSEDATLKALIEAETTARQNGDTTLANSISALKTDYESFKSTTTADLSAKKIQIDALILDMSNVKSIIDTHTTQMASINATITALQKTISTMETSLENMKTTVSELQTAWEEYKKSVDAEIDKMKQAIADLESIYVRLDAVMNETELSDVLSIFESV